MIKGAIEVECVIFALIREQHVCYLPNQLPKVHVV